MSSTATVTVAAKSISKSTDRYSVIQLSPSKRRCLSDEGCRKPTTQELWAWTLTPDAVAPCSLRDVLQMKENDTEDNSDFFWLGRVPCRTVKVVGMVIGVQAYEKRVIYSIDDGTSVVDCNHLQMPPPKTVQSKSQPPKKPEPEPLPKPIAYVGQFVRVIGKVQRKFDSRQIIIERIVRCSSANDELNHCRAVRELHRMTYSLDEPFSIPPLPTLPPPPMTPARIQEPSTPSTVVSDSESSATYSPTKSEAGQLVCLSFSFETPQKLRHPSRLHSRDLTDNTFRIYMKHYMDHAPDFTPEPVRESDYDSDMAVGTSLTLVPSTPTKPSRHRHEDHTPRAKITAGTSESTPRPRVPALRFGGSEPIYSTTVSSAKPQSNIRGFTLSYLRRVPELRELAKRVVKRRIKEERKKAKETGASQKRRTALESNIGPKMKRLFQWAIVLLLKEGGVVLWDGESRPILDNPCSEMSRLWRSSNSTIGADSTVFSVTSGTIREIDDDELSDPGVDEEIYLPLKPAYLAVEVEKAIKALSDAAEKMRHNASDPRVLTGGFTKDSILSFMKKDDRWRHIGDWHVEDALKFLELEGRAWCIGKGRWVLTL
ncbi:hypothetical protein BDQ12DRAFT_617837 [Crucibulum laeve]|uniref:CST complex subunit STN1 n=1 Tax=Crucibulum laeve TaxID=68775 RepID=A0A5C3LHA6_9AGAR|nr:hypothetical protein BDQ12DRAFT_617837 [Crucibulum laeve]